MSAAYDIPGGAIRTTYLSMWGGIRPRALSMAEITAMVAEEYGVTVKELRGQGRSCPIAWARQEAYRRCVAEQRFSLPQIGQFFGNRDHTTVLYGARVAEQRLKEDARP